jgi:hypothetical protein
LEGRSTRLNKGQNTVPESPKSFPVHCGCRCRCREPCPVVGVCLLSIDWQRPSSLLVCNVARVAGSSSSCQAHGSLVRSLPGIHDYDPYTSFRFLPVGVSRTCRSAPGCASVYSVGCLAAVPPATWSTSLLALVFSCHSPVPLFGCHRLALEGELVTPVLGLDRPVVCGVV